MTRCKKCGYSLTDHQRWRAGCPYCTARDIMLSGKMQKKTVFDVTEQNKNKENK